MLLCANQNKNNNKQIQFQVHNVTRVAADIHIHMYYSGMYFCNMYVHITVCPSVCLAVHTHEYHLAIALRIYFALVRKIPKQAHKSPIVKSPKADNTRLLQ